MRRAVAGLMQCVLAIASAAVLEAQRAQPDSMLTLQRAVAVAVVAHPLVRLAEQRIAGWRGVRLQSAAEFDGTISSAASSGEAKQMTSTIDGSPGTIVNKARETGYALRYDQAFRFGVTLSQELSVNQISPLGGFGSETGSASAQLQLRVPLLRNRGGVLTRMVEQAAITNVDGAIADARHVAAQVVAEVAIAYWNYVAADARLVVHQRTEDRAARLAEETRQLVAADERPASDTLQLLSNLARRRATRLNEEQHRLSAQERLGLAMGLDGASALSLPKTTTAFPVLPTAPDEFDYAPERVTQRLIATALDQRGDLLASTRRVRAAELELRSATSGVRPQMDLAVIAGYSGFVQDAGALGGFFAPLHRNVPGLNSTVQLSVRMPTSNAAARGWRDAAMANATQRDIDRADTKRRIITNVSVATLAVRQARLALIEATRSFNYAEQAVENEREKYRLGGATLFDVINAEDAMLTASLGDIAARQTHAMAIATLRFASGTLVDDRGRVRIADLSILP